LEEDRWGVILVVEIAIFHVALHRSEGEVVFMCVLLFFTLWVSSWNVVRRWEVRGIVVFIFLLTLILLMLTQIVAQVIVSYIASFIIEALALVRLIVIFALFLRNSLLKNLIFLK
jgi:hypothetical protein